MKYKYVVLFFFCISVMNSAYGQVYFGISYQAESEQYIVSAKSNQDIIAPLNTTGTAQVTIKFPSSDSFQVGNIVSLIPNVSWNKTIRVNRPVEADDYDYITFGLASLGTTHISYDKDSIVSLFAFENVGGACPGIVEIIDNTSDAFLYPNIQKLSIKNHISILGVGGNAYVGNYEKEANCKIIPSISTSTTSIEDWEISLYPNPSTHWVEVSFELLDDAFSQIIVYDAIGRQVLEENIQKGQNKEVLDISRLAQGSYFLRLEGTHVQSQTLYFVKIK